VEINGGTKVYAILGNPIAHTLSPAMYNAAFAAVGQNSVYIAFGIDEDGLGQAVGGLKALGVRGGNVTIPYKEKIIPYLDEISEEARLIGAVNTFYRDSWERLCGANTDGPGFIAALRKKDPKVLSVSGAVILGAGGSARAVAVSLALAGIKEITLVNRDIEKARKLGAVLLKLGCDAQCLDWSNPSLPAAVRAAGLLVNTTPLGMEPRTDSMPPMQTAWISAKHFVVDLIYKPAQTKLLTEAEKRGAQTMNGSGMLLEQALLSYELFTGSRAPVEVMAGALERRG